MYYSVKRLFCFNSRDRVSVIYGLRDPNSPLNCFNICYSISLLSDEYLIDFHTAAAASVRESIYVSRAMYDFVAG